MPNMPQLFRRKTQERVDVDWNVFLGTEGAWQEHTDEGFAAQDTTCHICKSPVVFAQGDKMWIHAGYENAKGCKAICHVKCITEWAKGEFTSAHQGFKGRPACPACRQEVKEIPGHQPTVVKKKSTSLLTAFKKD